MTVQKIKASWRSLFRKRRFNMLNATDNSEEWHIHLSPAGILAGSVALMLTLFILLLSLVAYSPVLEFLPGYRTEADRSRESIVQNIIRLDSLERMMADMLSYNENIALILDGKSPVTRSATASDSIRMSGKKSVAPSAEDSLLRAQMEGKGPYALARENNGKKGPRSMGIDLTPPADGIITERFDIAADRFGVRIAAAAGNRISATYAGTVVQCAWSPESGYSIVLQHPQNLISTYKNLARSLVEPGQAVRAGELIGYSAENPDGAEQTQVFQFELWNNGKPVDPENFIVF